MPRKVRCGQREEAALGLLGAQEAGQRVAQWLIAIPEARWALHARVPLDDKPRMLVADLVGDDVSVSLFP